MSKYIRGFWTVFFLTMFGVFAVVIRYTFMLFPLLFVKDEEEKIKRCSRILRSSWKFFLFMLNITGVFKIDKSNLEQIKNIKNSIIVSTHPSFIDVVVLMSLIPNTTCFVAEKLNRNIFFRGMVNLLFIIESSDIDKWLKQAKKMSDYGYNIIIFPMGFRHRKDEHPKIRKGAAILAQYTGKNIIELKAYTNYDYLMSHRPVYEVENEPVLYHIDYLNEINTQEMFNKYPDEVEFRKEITNHIAKTLYQ